MKNLMTNALILTVLLTSSQVFAAKASSGNGGGYNGPTLSGDAVVLSLDKPIKVKDLKDVYAKCLYNPATKEGVLKEIFKDIPNNNFELEKNYRLRINPALQIEEKIVDGKKVISYINFDMSIEAPNYYKLATYNSRHIPRMATEVTHGASSFTFNSDIAIMADGVKNVSTYDPITQDVIGTEEYFVGLKISRIPNAAAYVPLKNFFSDRETQLLAPVADLTNCLIDGLGRN